ncbi:manganese efflux pump MntP family protein [Oceanobacillus sp. 1P07AA]|uniref:manganese efflux pump MntP n=1 Tax=Oceanobacillus sp. 1P07AA TaxID=3132293 RepID=UPI0039A6358B
MPFSTEIISIFLLAVGLSMDGFSVSLGLGMQQLRLKRIAYIGLTIGFLHMLMPLAGMLLGQVISEQIGQWTSLASGVLLFLIGAHMFFSAFRLTEGFRWQPVGIGLWVIAFSVSLDSFTVGLGLGISGVQILITLFSFGLISCFVTWLGMLIGRKVYRFLGMYSELLGGSILCGFGIFILFS